MTLFVCNMMDLHVTEMASGEAEVIRWFGNAIATYANRREGN